MRIYTESSEETLRARKLLMQWSGDGFLSKEQYQRLEQDTVSDLRITNIFLRLVLFFFTMIGAVAAVALFFTVFLSRPSQQTTGIFLLIFSVVSYTAAEVAVTRARLYRHGIEEALAVCSVAFLYVSDWTSFFLSGSLPLLARDSVCGSRRERHCFALDLVPLQSVVRISRRDDLRHFLPGYWTPSHSAQHVFISVLYAAGLIWRPSFAPTTAWITLKMRTRPLRRFYGLAYT